jgi:phage-related protein
VFQFGADRIEKLIPLVDKLTPVFKQLGNTVSSIMATAWNTIKPFIDKVGEKADGLIDKITPYIEGLTPLIKSIGDTLEGSVAWALGLIEPVLTKALDVIDPLFKILEALGEVFFDIGETLWNAIQPVFDALGMNAESSQKGMMNFLDVVIKGLEIAAAIVKTMGKILNWIVGIVAGLLVPAIVAFIDAGRLIRSVIVSVITFLGKVLLGIVSGVQKVIEAFTGLGGALSNAWTVFKNGLARIPEALSKAWETVKAGFGAFGKGAAQALKTAGRGFAALGAPIKKFADGMGQFFTGFVDTLKSLWSGLTDFFSGLWEGIKNSPLEAVAFIKDAFLGLFDSIKERFFGFINTIKEGWEKVKGFLGGIGEGVANFFTGGGADKAGTPGGQSSAGASAGAGVTAGRQTGGLQPQKVNDLIVTPEGQYSTHPDDYIMAMKDPASVIDALVRFLGQGAAAQPAYTGAAAGGSPIETAFNGAATRQNTYNNATSSVSAPINVNVNTVGMTAEQAKNAIRRGVNDALSEAIHTSRRAIPKPEAGGL